MSEEEKYAERHSFTFTEVTWYERFWKFSSYLPKQIPIFAAVTASFWGVSEVLAEVSGEVLLLKDLAIPVLLTALAVAIFRAFNAYAGYVPDVLASESKAANDVYRRGKSGWQFALAREMLLQRLSELDRTQSRVESGSQFIRPVQMSGAGYLEWLQGRPELLIRLVRAIAVQCTAELPRVIGATQSEEDLPPLKSAIQQLAVLYEETVKFELEVRGVVPPDDLRRIHQMTFGWSSPARKGMLKFLEVLEAISKLNVKQVISGNNSMPDFGIEFLLPERLNEFIDALDTVELSSFS
jgi:hypothetical protein